ncbi:hypothetical protein YB2330_006093 [Saitoella coloradoensis]
MSQRQLTVTLTEEALLIAAAGVGAQGPRVRVSFGDAKVTSESSSRNVSSDASSRVSGIAGLLRLDSQKSYLVAITKATDVGFLPAEKKRERVYRVDDVVLIPLVYESAKEILEKLRKVQTEHEQSRSIIEDDEEDYTIEDSGSDYESEYCSDDDEGRVTKAESAEPATDPADESIVLDESPSLAQSPPRAPIAENVIKRRGLYGRIMKGWFGRKGFRAQGQDQLALFEGGSTPRKEKSDPFLAKTGAGAEAGAETKEDVKKEVLENEGFTAESLVGKLVKTIQVLFSSQTMFFCYAHDLTRQFQGGDGLRRGYIFNNHISQPFTDAGLEPLCVKLTQGFFGQRKLQLPEDKGEGYLTVISRRSCLRNGLRYMRRGLDDDGNCANFVETEEALFVYPPRGETSAEPTWFSHIQIRGSIPLFFSQSPYTLHPVPQLHRSDAANTKALQRHFENLKRVYGGVQCVNLVESQNREAIVGTKYEEEVRDLQDEAIGWKWFDFHHECKGMKFENISRLVANEDIDAQFQKYGWSSSSDGSRQKGVFRTNCMDCLDRTNVAQSAFGKAVLNRWLEQLNLELTPADSDNLNWIWADNGDAISRAYTGSAALKGEFVRTGVRDYKGVIADATNSLTRYFTNVVSDFFTQLVIDFVLGGVSAHAFDDFESRMMNEDPGRLVKAEQMRQNAIEVTAGIVIIEGEEMLDGWTLYSPVEPNTIQTRDFTELVLLLTAGALYACRFDFETERVLAFERIALNNVVSIQRGVYITSTLHHVFTDPKRNVGFVLRYVAGDADAIRTNHRSSNNTVDRGKGSSDIRVLVFKATPSQSGKRDEEKLVRAVVDEIATKCMSGDEERAKDLIEERDIVSLGEAQGATGYWERLEYGFRKWVWA